MPTTRVFIHSTDVIKEMVRRKMITPEEGERKLAKYLDWDTNPSREYVEAHVEEVLKTFPKGFDQESLASYLISLGYTNEEVTMCIMVLMDSKRVQYSPSGLLQLVTG